MRRSWLRLRRGGAPPGSEPAVRLKPEAGRNGGAARLVLGQERARSRRGVSAGATVAVAVASTERVAQCGFNNRVSALMTGTAP
jgi:hypothetical protein